MSKATHKTIPVRVWADVDEGIADLVLYLNTIPGVRTHASCQGTIGEGGPNPYRAQVMATWTAESEPRLRGEFDLTFEGVHWGYVHPREGLKSARGQTVCECSHTEDEHDGKGCRHKSNWDELCLCREFRTAQLAHERG